MPSEIPDDAQKIGLATQTADEALNKLNESHIPDQHRVVRDSEHRIPGIDAARTKNASLPVQRLPTEVFLVFVDHYLAISCIDSGWDMGTYRRLHVLTSVCWSWKRTIDTTPALWSQLVLGQSEKHAELCLSRSANCPLSIDFVISRYKVPHFYNVILPSLGRCSAIWLGVDTVGALEEHDVNCVYAFDCFKSTEMPILEILNLYGDNADIRDVDIFAIHPESPLKRVHFEGWDSFSLETPPPPTLKHLSLAAIWYHVRNSLDPSLCFDILHQLPALEYLEVRHVDFEPIGDTTPTAISLRHLKHLRLVQGYPFILQFLKRVDMPSLQKFHVEPFQELSYAQDSHTVDELELLMHPLIHNALQLLPRTSSLRLEVTSEFIFVVKVRDDVEDYIQFFSFHPRVKPTLSLQWLSRILQDAPRPIPLHITFTRLPQTISDESLSDTLISLPDVRTITVEGCLDVTPLMRFLVSKSTEDCPLPELTDLVLNSIGRPVDPGLVEWVQNSRTGKAAPINFLINNDASSA